MNFHNLYTPFKPVSQGNYKTEKITKKLKGPRDIKIKTRINKQKIELEY